MAAEMAAPRLLAPTFGASQLIWTHVIGTILIALAVGAWVGGRLADRWPSQWAYGCTLVLAGCLLWIVPVVSRPALLAADGALARHDIAGTWLGLAVACLAFVPPVLLLGMITPWAVRLGGFGRPDLGSVAGRLSSLTALGSILGTFVTSLLALPLLGTQTTILTAASMLAAVGILVALKRPAAPVAALLVLLVPLMAGRSLSADPSVVFAAESRYQHVRVRVDDAGWTRLLLDSPIGYHSVKPPVGLLTGGVWDTLSLIPAMTGAAESPFRMLLLGLAAGTLAWQVEEAYGATRSVDIDGVEIDPLVVEAAREFFGMDELSTLRVHVGDARPTIARLHGPYEAIVVDAYRTGYVPFQLATEEFFVACRQRLAPGGIVAVNLALPRAGGHVLEGFHATLGAVFPHLAQVVIPGDGFPFENVVLLASSSPLMPPEFEEVPKKLQGPHVTNMRTRWVDIPTAVYDIQSWTDDRAPIELMTDLSIRDLLRR